MNLNQQYLDEIASYKANEASYNNLISENKAVVKQLREEISQIKVSCMF